jgi:hypothetical protein
MQCFTPGKETNPLRSWQKQCTDTPERALRRGKEERAGALEQRGAQKAQVSLVWAGRKTLNETRIGEETKLDLVCGVPVVPDGTNTDLRGNASRFEDIIIKWNKLFVGWSLIMLYMLVWNSWTQGSSCLSLPSHRSHHTQLIFKGILANYPNAACTPRRMHTHRSRPPRISDSAVIQYRIRDNSA